jgi:3alpha(or 20beta)-hydroxysteroid dehydrogenase
MELLLGKVALVTGAAQGLGEAIARTMQAEGATVILTDIEYDSVKAVAHDLGGAARALKLDVTDQDAWRSSCSSVMDEFGRIDILVNNAGIAEHTSILRSDGYESYLRVVNVDQHGVFLGMWTVLPYMTAAGRGAVVNIASINALRGVPENAGYCPAKAAVLGMTRAAALEVAASGVRINAVCPGLVDTPLLRGADRAKFDLSALMSRVPMGRPAEAHEIADFVAFLSSDRASYCNGAEYVIDGGTTIGYH